MKTTPTGPRGGCRRRAAAQSDGDRRVGPRRGLEALRRLGTSATVDRGESLAASRARWRRRARRSAAATARGRRTARGAASARGARRRLGGRARRRQLRFDASAAGRLLPPSPLVALGVASLLLGGGGGAALRRARTPCRHAAALCSGGAGVRGGAAGAWATAALLPRGRPPRALRLVVSAAVAARR